MSWEKILKRVRGNESTEAGMYKRLCRRWIQNYFSKNWEKRKVFWEKFDNGEISIEEFVKLLKKASLYIPEEEREEYKSKFTNGTLTDEEMNYILKYAIPDMFFVNDMITSVGGNPQLRKDYNHAMGLLMNERKATEMVLTEFWNAPEYEELVNNGHTDSQIWRIFMDAAVRRGVFPCFCDPADGKYKLLDLNAYVYILQRRNQSIATEVVNKARDYQRISGMFPTVHDLLPATDGEVERLRPFETLKLNPPQYTCPFCNEVFTDERFYKRHLVYEHGAKEKN